MTDTLIREYDNRQLDEINEYLEWRIDALMRRILELELDNARLRKSWPAGNVADEMRHA